MCLSSIRIVRIGVVFLGLVTWVLVFHVWSANVDPYVRRVESASVVRLGVASFQPDRNERHEETPQDPSKPFRLVFTEDHLLNTTATRIDFFSPDWYDQFLAVQRALDDTPSMSESTIEAWWEAQEGYSDGQIHHDYCILTNGCIQKSGNLLYAREKKGRSMQHRLYALHRVSDFYYTTLFSHREAFNASSFLPDGQHLLSLHPRRYLNIYHVLSGLSLLLRVAIHPEAYPNITFVVLHNHPTWREGCWGDVMERLFLHTLSPKHRPVVLFSLHALSATPMVCDKAMTVAKAWEPFGSGSFIGEPLAGDLLRSVAYRYVNVSFVKPRRNECLRGLWQRRVVVRVIENEVAMIDAVRVRYSTELELEAVVFERISMVDQIRHMALADVLIAPHGAGLSNIVFMTPRSCLYELVSPYWQIEPYMRLAKSAGLLYMRDVGEGVNGTDMRIVKANRRGSLNPTRNLNYVMNQTLVTERVGECMRAVWREKYGFEVFSVCS